MCQIGILRQHRVQLPLAELDLALGADFAVGFRLQRRRVRPGALRPAPCVLHIGPGVLHAEANRPELAVEHLLFLGFQLDGLERFQKNILAEKPVGQSGGHHDGAYDNEGDLRSAHTGPGL